MFLNTKLEEVPVQVNSEPVARAGGGPFEESFVQVGATLGAHATARTKMKVHKRASGKRNNPHAEHVPSDEMDLLIETINNGDFGWKADICKLQKHHHMYDAEHCEKKANGTLNLAQITNEEATEVDVENAFVGTDAVLDGKKGKEEKAFGQGDDFGKAW